MKLAKWQEINYSPQKYDLRLRVRTVWSITMTKFRQKQMNIINRFISPQSETQSQDVTAIYEWAKYWGHLFNSLKNKAPKIPHQFFLRQKLSNRWSFNISYDTRWCFMCSRALLNSYFKKFWFVLKNGLLVI